MKSVFNVKDWCKAAIREVAVCKSMRLKNGGQKLARRRSLEVSVYAMLSMAIYGLFVYVPIARSSSPFLKMPDHEPEARIAEGTLELDPPLPRPIVLLIQQFEEEHGEPMAPDLMERLEAYWSLYHDSTLARAESILRAEQIPPRERMVELDVFLRSREGEWTAGSVVPYVANKSLDMAKDNAIIAGVAICAPYLSVPLKMILDANTFFSFLPGFSVGYGDDVIAYLEKEQQTDRYAEVHRFMLELRTLSADDISRRIAANERLMATNNAALMNLPDELRRTVMAELPERLERLVPGIDRPMLWLYVSGQPMPPGLRAQIEHALGGVPQWNSWLQSAHQHFVRTWHQTMRIMREQVLLNQLNDVAWLRLAADDVCVGRTFEAQSSAGADRRIRFSFVLMTPAEVVARVSARKGAALDAREGDRILEETYRRLVSDDLQLGAIRAALPAGCYEQVRQRKLFVMFHGPYRSGTGSDALQVEHEWVRGFMTRSLTYWPGTDQPRTETRWDPTGQSREEWQYTVDGQRVSLVTWRDRTKHGVEAQWRADGTPVIETHWRDGKREGPETHWYDNGLRRQERHFQADRVHGMVRVWHTNGTLAQQGNFEQGHPRGLHTSWWDNGQKYEEGHYAEDSQIGIQQGLWVRWDRDGKCIDATEHVWDSATGTRYSRRGRCP